MPGLSQCSRRHPEWAASSVSATSADHLSASERFGSQSTTTMALFGLVVAILEAGLQANSTDGPTGFLAVVPELHGTVGTESNEVLAPEPIASSKVQRLPRCDTAGTFGKWPPKFQILVSEEPHKKVITTALYEVLQVLGSPGLALGFKSLRSVRVCLTQEGAQAGTISPHECSPTASRRSRQMESSG